MRKPDDPEVRDEVDAALYRHGALPIIGQEEEVKALIQRVEARKVVRVSI